MRKAEALTTPSSSGIILPTILAAPVVVGIIFSVAERPRRIGRSTSNSTCELVYECTVVIKPWVMVKASCKIFSDGTKALVVQEPKGNNAVFGSIKLPRLTPGIMLTSSSFAGAEMSTWRAPAWICTSASAALVNLPDASTTQSTPNFFQSSFAGFKLVDERNGNTVDDQFAGAHFHGTWIFAHDSVVHEHVRGNFRAAGT